MFKIFKKQKNDKVDSESKSNNHLTEIDGGILKVFKSGLKKSSEKINAGLADIFSNKPLDKEALEELEDLLISTDMGIQTSSDIINYLSKKKLNKNITVAEVKEIIANKINNILADYSKELVINSQNRPHIILFCGVNGSGKTTSIGKIAALLKAQSKKVMLVASDTFRAGASDQLQEWAERANVDFYSSHENADPASVAYMGIQEAVSKNIDVVLVDTAGRLHNNSNLMQELEKIIRIIKKHDSTAPHNYIFVLDAVTGQNAHNQMQDFYDLIGCDGLIITKMDGTAKGGILVSLVSAYHTPIYYLGLGENIEDLKVFDPKLFADNLLD